jgi:hypothetical protein
MKARGVQPHIYPAILTRNDTIDRAEREWSCDVWRTTIPLPTPESKVVVVFTDVSVTPSSNSMYLADIIRTNLAKNNVVIEVVRNLLENNVVHPPQSRTSQNHLVRFHDDPSAPLFFPRVDECYYTPHSSNTAYDTMREVSCVIDLWNNHKEMTLYVIKTQLNQLQSEDHPSYGSNRGNNNESDTEGFESDDNAQSSYLIPLDYCKIIEEYYRSKFSKVEMLMGRKLVVLF